MPILLLSIGLWLLSILYTSSQLKKTNVYLLGAVLGFIPFAKLQATPLGVIVAFFSALLIFKRYGAMQTFYFALSGLLPAVFILLITAAGGGLESFWNQYLVYNFDYAGRENPQDISLMDYLQYAWGMLFKTPDVAVFFQAGLIACLVACMFFDVKAVLKDPASRTIIVFAIALFVTTLYCIGKPFRNYSHYILFGFFSTTVLLTAILCALFRWPIKGEGSKIDVKLAVAPVLLFIVILAFHLRFSFDPVYNTYAARNTLGYTYMPEVVKAMYANTKPGDKLALWGWSGTFYSDTDLTMGTRFCDTSGIITKNPSQEFLLKTYIGDLERNKPKIFLDAISPNAFLFGDRTLYGIGNFPSLQQYINTNYNMVADIEGYRVYVRQ